MSSNLPKAPEDAAVLARQIKKLKKINASLMSRVERAGSDAPNAFALFEHAATLDGQVRHQTQDLREALRVLERSNEALQQAKDIAEAANALKTSFLASISHDLLQPLHAARLGLSVLGDKLETAEAPSILHQADRSLNTLESIITTLLDIAKLEAGVLKPHMRAFAIDGLIEELCAEFVPIASQRGLILRRSGSASTVMSDPLLLRRILQNLLSNALRYTRRGGVALRSKILGEKLRIAVIDTGPGIAPDRQVAIFEEFQRDDCGVQSEPGSGLGLSIVRRLALAMDHEIRLWSRPGLGSVFSVFVPLAEVDANFTKKHRGLPFSDVQVLLLGSEDAAEATAALLSQWGCEVARADSLEDAKVYLQTAERAPDLLIADCTQSSSTTGAAAIESLRAVAASVIPGFLIGDQTEAASGLQIVPPSPRPAELRALMTFLIG